MENRNLAEVRQLISTGKKKGFLTFDEVNEMLPPDLTDSEQIDDIMMLFDEMDIEIIDSKPVHKKEEEVEEPLEEPEEEEKKENKIINAVITTPLAIREVISMGDRIRKGRLKIGNVVSISDFDEMYSE